RSEVKNHETFALTERIHSMFRVEEIGAADAAQIGFTVCGIRVDLDRSAQCNHDEAGTLSFNLTIHLGNQALGHGPGITPSRIGRRTIYLVVESGLMTCNLRSRFRSTRYSMQHHGRFSHIVHDRYPV